MNNKINNIKHAYWIHKKIPNENATKGFFYSRECKCSACGYEANIEKKSCPSCKAIMDEQPQKQIVL